MLCHFVLLPKALANNGLLMNPPNKFVIQSKVSLCSED